MTYLNPLKIDKQINNINLTKNKQQINIKILSPHLYLRRIETKMEKFSSHKKNIPSSILKSI